MKDEHQNEFGEQTRYEMRKKRNMNRILNTSIAVVGALILFFAVQLFLSGDDQATEEELSDTQEESPESPESTDENSDVKGPEEPPGDNSTQVDESDNENSSEDSNSEQESEDEGQTEESQTIDPTGEGEWEPIGTEQSGSYQPDFNQGSQNWEEMEKALQHATDISEADMVVWWLENGGGNQAIGTVSTKENQATPYRVTMEFIENEGWQPLKVEKMNSNPYLG